MRKMLFNSSQDPVSIIPLPNGMWDVIVLDGEEMVMMESYDIPESESPKKTAMFQYDGNIFRTVYELTEEEILSDMPKWLNYTTKDEPTVEQLKHDNELIDQMTMELVEGGIL